MAVQSLLDALDVTMGLPTTWSSCNFHRLDFEGRNPSRNSRANVKGKIRE